MNYFTGSLRNTCSFVKTLDFEMQNLAKKTSLDNKYFFVRGTAILIYFPKVPYKIYLLLWIFLKLLPNEYHIAGLFGIIS